MERIKDNRGSENNIVLNRSSGGFPYEVHLNIRVSGKNADDALESVIEFLQDHRDEVFIPMYPDMMHYPES